MAIGQPEVAVFDGDPVVREALEVLLQAAGYRIRLLVRTCRRRTRGPTRGRPSLIDRARAGCRAPEGFFWTMTSNRTSLVKLPILELVPEGGEQQVKGGRVVLWPCSTEELRRAIHAALFGEE